MAVDMFLKLDGIKGESSDAKHKDAIQIESFSWGLSQTGGHGGGGGGAGKASFQDFSFISRVNAASPKLALACASGQHIKSAVLTARKSEDERGQDYLIITLADILVSSYQSAGNSGQMPESQIPGVTAGPPEVPGQVAESFSLNYTKIEFSYAPQQPDGSLGAPVKMGWDVKTSSKI